MKQRLKLGVLCLVLFAVLVSLTVPLGLNLGNLLLLRAVINEDPKASQMAQRLLSDLSRTRGASAAYRSLARLALLEGRFETAWMYGLQALDNSPSDWETHDLLGRAFWALGEKQKARQTWREMDQLRPRLERLSFLGWQSFGQGDYEAGIAYFEQGLDLDPNWAAGYWALSGYYWDIQQVERARPYLEKAVQLFPQGGAEQLFVAGRLNLLEGNYAAAEDQFCTAWSLSPQPWFLDACLWVLWHEGNFEQGWQIIEETARRYPQMATGYAETWGDRLFSAGYYESAVRFYQIACPEVKSDVPACVQLAEALRLASNSQ